MKFFFRSWMWGLLFDAALALLGVVMFIAYRVIDWGMEQIAPYSDDGTRWSIFLYVVISLVMTFVIGSIIETERAANKRWNALYNESETWRAEWQESRSRQ